MTTPTTPPAPVAAGAEANEKPTNDTALLDLIERHRLRVQPDGMDGWLVRGPLRDFGMRQGYPRFGAHRLREALADAAEALGVDVTPAPQAPHGGDVYDDAAFLEAMATRAGAATAFRLREVAKRLRAPHGGGEDEQREADRMRRAMVATCKGCLAAALGDPLHAVAQSGYASRTLEGDAWEHGWQFIAESALFQDRIRWQVTVLRSALENWGAHFGWCASHQNQPCDCGLAAALNDTNSVSQIKGLRDVPAHTA